VTGGGLIWTTFGASGSMCSTRLGCDAPGGGHHSVSSPPVTADIWKWRSWDSSWGETCLFVCFKHGNLCRFSLWKNTFPPGQGGDDDAFPCQGSENGETTRVRVLAPCFHIEQHCQWIPSSFVADPERGSVPTRRWSMLVRSWSAPSEGGLFANWSISGETFHCYWINKQKAHMVLWQN